MEPKVKTKKPNGTINVERGEESYSDLVNTDGPFPVARVQYLYRSYSGKLFYTDQETLEECRDARDEWVRKLH